MDTGDGWRQKAAPPAPQAAPLPRARAQGPEPIAGPRIGDDRPGDMHPSTSGLRENRACPTGAAGDYNDCMKFALAVLIALAALPAPHARAASRDIYDAKADGTLLIEAALVRAHAEHKRVLLDFGANWCPWCHSLHRLFTDDRKVSAALNASYVLVMVDVNTRDGVARNAGVNARYGNPVRLGLPVLVVLDGNGKPLCTQDTGELEEGRGHSPAKVLAFLRRWSGRRG